jgi:hypothetical protein
MTLSYRGVLTFLAKGSGWVSECAISGLATDANGCVTQQAATNLFLRDFADVSPRTDVHHFPIPAVSSAAARCLSVADVIVMPSMT